MEKTLRAKLREAISRDLVPELKQRGFTGPDKIAGNKIDHEYVRKSPKQLEVLSIQFDKYQRPRFILNTHIDPAEGCGKAMEGRAAYRDSAGLLQVAALALELGSAPILQYGNVFSVPRPQGKTRQ